MSAGRDDKQTNKPKTKNKPAVNGTEARRMKVEGRRGGRTDIFLVQTTDIELEVDSGMGLEGSSSSSSSDSLVVGREELRRRKFSALMKRWLSRCMLSLSSWMSRVEGKRVSCELRLWFK